MTHSIIIEPEAQQDLRDIFSYIAENDSSSKAQNFIKQLQTAINSLEFMPQRCKKSLYIDDENTKDLIYHGYTICYHILENNVHIVAVFRQR